MAYSNELMQKFVARRRNHPYFNLPPVISIENGRVDINPKALLFSIEAFNSVSRTTEGENAPIYKAVTRTAKLQATSWGDWGLSVYAVKTSYFANREEFNQFIKHQYFEQEPQPMQTVIALRDAFRQTGVEITVDYQHLMESGDKEMRIRIQEFLWMNPGPYGERRLQDRLLNATFGQLFGASTITDLHDEETGAKQFALSDFQVCCQDGNERRAAARHGEFYLFFRFGTS